MFVPQPSLCIVGYLHQDGRQLGEPRPLAQQNMGASGRVRILPPKKQIDAQTNNRHSQTKHLPHDLLQPPRRILHHPHTPPRDKAIRPHHQDPILLHLPPPFPVPIDILIVLTPADTVPPDSKPSPVQSQLPTDCRRRVLPRLAAQAGEDAEAAVAREVDGGQLLARGAGVDPRVRQPVSREGADAVVQYRIVRPRGRRAALPPFVRGDHGRRLVALVHLHAQPVELVRRALDRVAETLPPRLACGRGRFQLVERGHAFGDGGEGDAHCVPDGGVVADALVRARDDADADGLALGGEGGE